MVKPGFLKNDSVITWLDGVEPAWSLLDYESYCRLRLRPDEGGGALLLKSDLSAKDVGASPIVTATLHMLQMASEKGVKLTESGKLSRSMVTEIADIVAGPAVGLALIRSVTKVLNESDIWPAELLRHVVLDLRLVRRKGNVLVPTAKGLKMLAANGSGELLARLFEVVFYRINLGRWDGYPVPSWPQSDIGIIAWSLSFAAADWETPRQLVRLATVPVIGILEAKHDFAGLALELRILRMLALFGLLDSDEEPDPVNRFRPIRRYRTTALYKRFLAFDVTLEPLDGTRH
jgi:hypothetical protein